MRLLILSDLHHELWRDHAPKIDIRISRPDAVVLAGDINTGAKAVVWAIQTFPNTPVLYVHGNHESYGKNLEETHKEIEAECARAENIHFLNCGEYIFRNVRFLGATMWTDFRLFGDATRQGAMHEAEVKMADYEWIRLAQKDSRKLRASDTAQFHSLHKSWIRTKIAEPFSGKTVVITHMAPSMLSVPEKYSSNPISASYASRLDDLASQSDVWIHGHMHESFDYRIGKCRVICNPCGYMTRGGGIENGKFDPNFILELE